MPDAEARSACPHPSKERAALICSIEIMDSFPLTDIYKIYYYIFNTFFPC
jgi:hypothetical protein